jgi:hypothetical protein
VSLRLSITLVFLCIAHSFLQAQPMIAFDSASFTVPPVPPDTLVSFAIRFSNTGDSTLIITSALHSDGGLSGAVLERNNIPPGELGTLLLQFKVPSFRRSRPWRRSMTVTSNAKNYPVFRFDFGGEIVDRPSDIHLNEKK